MRTCQYYKRKGDKLCGFMQIYAVWVVRKDGAFENGEKSKVAGR